MKETNIYIGNIENLNLETVRAELFQEMPLQRQRRINLQKNEADRKRSLMAGYLLLWACQEHGIELCAYREDESGKPYFAQEQNSSSLFSFNLSHSGEYAVCGCSTQCRVGIDIQREREMPDTMATKILCEEEFKNLPKDAFLRQQMLLRYWTIKESYCKLTGDGLSYGFPNCYVDFERKMVIDCKKASTISKRRAIAIQLAYFQEYEVAAGYYGAMCMEQKVEEIGISFVTI